MSFKTRVENNTASVSGFDLTEALEKGLEYVLSVIGQNPALLEEFSSTQTSAADGVDWIKDAKGMYLLNVSRQDGSVYREARKVPKSVKDKIGDSSSIHFATALSPAYYIEGRKIFMRPIAGSSKLMKLELVQNKNGYTINDNNEKIYNADGDASTQSGFPPQFNELVVLHASECILMEKLSEFTNKLPTDLDSDLTMFDKIADISAQISLDTSLPSFTAPTFRDASDALTKAQNLIDGTTMGGDTENESVQYWLADEDEDMVQATLSTASQELQRASTILSDYNAELSRSVSQFQQDVAKMGLELNEEQAKQQAKIAELQANLNKSIQLYNTLIQKIDVDFKYLTSQLQMVSGKKQEFVQLNITPKKLDVNERQV
tara:strand:+ start:8983 stop:10110 length:1128 start_codon:yes stop_codon:yes gene_type:complete